MVKMKRYTRGRARRNGPLVNQSLVVSFSQMNKKKFFECFNGSPNIVWQPLPGQPAQFISMCGKHYIVLVRCG